MRPIDADALYNRLSSFTGMFTDEIGFAVNLNQVLDCIDVAPTIEQPTWISVEERLPEQDGKFLIVIEYTTIWGDDEKHVGELAYFSVELNKWLRDGHRLLNVTHWMPLPEPPKGVE